MIKKTLTNSKKNIFAFINEAKPAGFGVTILSIKSAENDAYFVVSDYNHAVSLAERLIK